MFETCWEAKSSIKLRRIEGWASNPPIFGAGDGRFLIRKGKCSHISALGFDSTVKVVECKIQLQVLLGSQSPVFKLRRMEGWDGNPPPSLPELETADFHY